MKSYVNTKPFALQIFIALLNKIIDMIVDIGIKDVYFV